MHYRSKASEDCDAESKPCCNFTLFSGEAKKTKKSNMVSCGFNELQWPSEAIALLRVGWFHLLTWTQQATVSTWFFSILENPQGSPIIGISTFSSANVCNKLESVQFTWQETVFHMFHNVNKTLGDDVGLSILPVPLLSGKRSRPWRIDFRYEAVETF